MSLRERLKEFSLSKPIFLPELSRKTEKGRTEHSIGLSDWTTRVHSSVDKKGNHFNEYVEVVFIKGSEDINYEIIEMKSEVVVRYYWNDFDKNDLDLGEDECE